MNLSYMLSLKGEGFLCIFSKISKFMVQDHAVMQIVFKVDGILMDVDLNAFQTYL